MAYAYLFKYIIIGDTGEKAKGKEPLRNGEARPEGQAACATPASAAPFPQCWLRRRGSDCSRKGEVLDLGTARSLTPAW